MLIKIKTYRELFNEDLSEHDVMKLDTYAGKTINADMIATFPGVTTYHYNGYNFYPYEIDSFPSEQTDNNPVTFRTPKMKTGFYYDAFSEKIIEAVIYGDTGAKYLIAVPKIEKFYSVSHNRINTRPAKDLSRHVIEKPMQNYTAKELYLFGVIREPITYDDIKHITLVEGL